MNWHSHERFSILRPSKYLSYWTFNSCPALLAAFVLGKSAQSAQDLESLQSLGNTQTTKGKCVEHANRHRSVPTSNAHLFQRPYTEALTKCLGYSPDREPRPSSLLKWKSAFGLAASWLYTSCWELFQALSQLCCLALVTIDNAPDKSGSTQHRAALSPSKVIASSPYLRLTWHKGSNSAFPRRNVEEPRLLQNKGLHTPS